MTDRTTHTSASGADDRRDALVDLYRDATAHDAGPSQPMRERVLAYARQRAPAQPAVTQREAANDYRWLRHALGSVAVIGLVGWLSFQHLDQQTESMQPMQESVPAQESSAPAAADTEEAVRGAPAPVPAPALPPAAPAAKRAEDRSKQASELQPRAPANATAPRATREPAVVSPDASRAAPQVERAMRDSDRPQPSAAPSAMVRKRANAASSASDMVDLPVCGEEMDAAALAEQTRRIKARDKAQAAGQSAGEPAPVCRPAPATMQPHDNAR